LENFALKNLIFGVVKTISVVFITMFLTSFLLRELGRENFGIISLIVNINQYLVLPLVVFSGTVFKFVSEEYYRKDFGLMNKYYSTAFFGASFVGITILLVSYLAVNSVNVSTYIGWQSKETDLFFLISLGGLLLANISNIFVAPLTVEHKVYMSDFSSIASKALQLILILSAAYYINNITLSLYSYSILLNGLALIIFTYSFSKLSVQNAKISMKYVSWDCLTRMIKMGAKLLLNNIGILLYTSTDMIIIGYYLNSTDVADYAISLQLSLFIAVFGSIFSRLLNPVISKSIVDKSDGGVMKILNSYTKIFILYIGALFVLIVIFSDRILDLWLGDDYIYLAHTVILLSIYHLLHQSTVLFSTFFLLKNRLTVPLFATISFGFLNVAASIFIVKYTEYGVHGIIYVTIFTVLLKTVLFNTAYATKLLCEPLKRTLITIFKHLFFVCLFCYTGNLVVSYTGGQSILILFLQLISISCLYLFIAYKLILSFDEKNLVLRILRLDRFLINKGSS
jgi:O-antigen/teichoic acid export membrane protein